MKLLKRLLRGQPCSSAKRFGRWGSSKGTGLVFGAEARRRRHQQACEECTLRERRQQQYLERLRGAAVPVASDDLTARLLARTEALAREAARTEAPAEVDASLSGASPVDPRGAVSVDGAPWGPAWGPARTDVRPRLRVAALTAGVAAAAVVLTTGSAYLAGGSPAPLTAGQTSTSFPQKDLGVPATAPDATPAPGWSVPGEPDITPADALSAAQLTALRAQGWACPELHDLGFHLVWARSGVATGADVVELRLTDGLHFATVLEQHAGRPPQQGGPDSRQSAAGPPVNVLTGHPAGADGFTAASAADAARPADIPPGTPWGDRSSALWVNPAPPFRAIVQGSAGTFTYVSDQPADKAWQGLAALAATSAPLHPEAPAEAGRTPDESGADGVKARITRGLARILELLAR